MVSLLGLEFIYMFLIILFLVPTFAILSSLYLYQHTGKREILRFDLVQFVYAFILAPIVYVWFKSFLFVFLVSELNLHLSVTDLFIADTIFTIIFLYVFAFLVIHSLTKSFELKRLRDPFYDIFQHSEFFHLITSHVILYFGLVLLITIISTVNVFIPLEVANNMLVFSVAMALGFLVGVLIYTGLLLTDDEFDIRYPRFEMFVELLFIVFFIYNIGLYFYFRPSFDLEYIMYWFVFMVLGGFITGSLVLDRSEKIVRRLKKFHYKSPKLTDPLIKEKAKKKKSK